MSTIVLNTPAQAQYGRSPTGASDARDDWWNHAGDNNADQAAVQGGMGYANLQASGQGGTAPAVENQGLVNNVAGGANGNQAGAVTLAQRLATGNGPSEAAYQLQHGLDQGVAQQRSMASSGRGFGALATGQAAGRENTANLQQNAFTQGGLLRSQDMTTGRGLLGTALSTQRDQDNAAIGQANDMSQFNATQADKNTLGMGQAGVALGDAGNAQNAQDLGYYNQGMNPVDAQSEADQAKQLWASQNQKQKAANNSQEFGNS